MARKKRILVEQRGPIGIERDADGKYHLTREDTGAGLVLDELRQLADFLLDVAKKELKRG